MDIHCELYIIFHFQKQYKITSYVQYSFSPYTGASQ